MLTIGDFSKLAGLTVKTLRFYHEQELLVPSFVDPGTGYRYYDAGQLETARLITLLRGMEFSIAQIKEILDHGQDDELLTIVEKQRDTLNERARHFRQIVRALDRFLSEERQAGTMTQTAFPIEEKSLEPLLVAAVSMRGRYGDCGQGFGRIGRAMGRYVCGKPLLLHHDSEYREEDAHFEACMPVRQARPAEGVEVRELPGGPCVALLHKGSYETLSRSYARILEYVRERGYTIVMPTREVYVKGPGMIFRGNPKNYLTEIQIPVESPQARA